MMIQGMSVGMIQEMYMYKRIFDGRSERMFDCG